MIDIKNILSSIQNFNLKDESTLFIRIKTNEQGEPYYSVDEVLEFYKIIQKALQNQNVNIILLPDKFQLFSIESAEECKKYLEECILNIQEAANKAGDIKKAKGREEFSYLNL